MTAGCGFSAPSRAVLNSTPSRTLTTTGVNGDGDGGGITGSGCDGSGSGGNGAGGGARGGMSRTAGVDGLR